MPHARDYKYQSDIAYSALKQDSRNIYALSAYVQATSMFDRHAAINQIDKYLLCSTEGADIARGLSLKIQHEESIHRQNNGLDVYASDNVDEDPFIFSVDTLMKLRDAAIAWLSESSCIESAELLARIEYCCSNYISSENILTDIRETNSSLHAKATNYGDKFFAGLGREIDSKATRFPEIRFIKEPVGGQRIFIGCDQIYFDIYARGMINSIAKNSRASVHCHIFNSDGKKQREYMESVLGDNFSLSVEDASFTNSNNGRFYYASMRIPRMFQVYRELPAPTLFLDVDMWAGKSLSPIFDKIEKYDVSIFRMPGRSTFHTQVNASVLGIGTTNASYSYAAFLAGYIIKTISNGVAPWCLDQIAINSTYQYFKRIFDIHPRAVSTGPSVENGTFDAMLWPQKIAPSSPHLQKWFAAKSMYGGGDPEVMAA